MARPSKPGKAPTRRKTSTAASDKTSPPSDAVSADATTDTSSDPARAAQSPAIETTSDTPVQDTPAPSEQQSAMADPTTSTRVTPVQPVSTDALPNAPTQLTPPTDPPSEEFAAAVVIDDRKAKSDFAIISDADLSQTTDGPAITDTSTDNVDALTSPPTTPENDALVVQPTDPETPGDNSVDNTSTVATQIAPDAPQDEGPKRTTPPPDSLPPPARAGFFPLVLGGIVAAGIGFGAAQLLRPMGAQTTDLSTRLSDLEGRVTLMSGELSTQIGDLSATIGGDPLETVLPMIDSLTARVDDQDARLATLSEAGDTSEQLAAALAELDTRVSEQVGATLSEPLANLAALREDITSTQNGLRADIENLRALAETQLAEAEADAADAANRAARSAARLALGDISTAFDTGAPFIAVLPDITAAGVDMPALLQDTAESGVPTLADLQDSFTPAARRALGASLSAVDAGSVTDRVALFLRSQTNARSLSARDGDDPDAVLSRAEAALRAGRVANAINELDALPDAGRAAMVDWIAQAQLRADAMVGLTTLQNQLTAE